MPSLQPSSSRVAAASELLRRRKIRNSFEAWCETALEPFGQKPAAHHKLLIRELEAVARGENDRLMIWMPPGSAKSTYASVLFPPWFMAQPGGPWDVIGASHGANLAEDFSGRVIRTIQEHGRLLGLELTSQSKELWRTTKGDMYRAAGAGGAIAGRSSSLFIIDDPHKSQEEADSAQIREKIWNWYRSDVITRLKPGARIVLIQTRWHTSDLSGKLLEEMQAGADQWRIINLPAIAEEHDALGRNPGDPLWPEWEDKQALARKRRNVGARAWSALYQQRPTSEEGAILLRHWWQHWTGPKPEYPEMTIVSLDTAYTEKEQNDPTACTVWDIVTNPDTYKTTSLLRYAWRERLEFPKLIDHIERTLRHFQRGNVPLRLLVEPKANGLSVIQELRRRLPDLMIVAPKVKGDKVARAHAVTSLLQAGHVSAMADAAKEEGGEPTFRPWAQMVIDECAAFPLGAHDDLVDSTTHALRYVRDLGFEFFEADEPAPPPVREAGAFY